MKHYAIFGAGRVGPNMAAYLEHLGHKASLITKDAATNRKDACAAIINECDIVAAAIPDSALEGWRDEWRAVIGERPAIHFSGAVTIAGIFGYHPLYSFPHSKLEAGEMETIAFCCPQTGPSFSDIFPDAPNPHFEIADDDRAHYHALAVLSGNLTSFIWNAVAKDIAAYSGAPPERILRSYLGSIVDRFVEAPADSMTGPVARRDRVTAAANLEALQRDPKLQKLYEAFLDAAWPDYRAKAE